ncbi:hypothetical protein V6N11_007863 [Hibiscus sabdariffa]|uniref:Pentatricopeptide repeat-containing protein n=1 Tax=Hibiscus sabdariffa TaxID=183260 RepID=A0ABR2PYW7_9ROSI
MTMRCAQNGQVREAFNILDEMVAKELTCASKEILGATPKERLNLELAERVEGGLVATTTSIKVTASKLDLKMNNKCAVRMFDEMLKRYDKVKVDKHFNAVCGDSNEI